MIEDSDFVLVSQKHAGEATPPAIYRENLLDAIDDQLAVGHHGLVVEGESGDGKTNLLRAYSHRHSSRTVFIEVSAASRWGYNPDYVIQQIGFAAAGLLGLRLPTVDQLFTETDLQTLYIKLRRRGSPHEPTLFVVDGLHEIPPEDSNAKRRLLDLIPIGMGGISVVLSDSVPSMLTMPAHAHLRHWRLARFTLDETRGYLRNVVPNASDVVEMHRLFKGRPGSLAVVHRLIVGGILVEDLLRKPNGQLESLIEQEWNLHEHSDASALRVLCLLTVSRTALSALDASRILNLALEEVQANLAAMPFVCANSDGTVAIESDTMRQFIARKVNHLKKEVLDLVIADLQRDPDVRRSLSSLPRYFQDAGRLEDLVGYLTTETLTATLKTASSLLPIVDTLSAGLDAAGLLKKDGAAYRFALQRSAVSELGTASTWDPYIDAVLSLRDFEQAIEIAESVPLAGEKLLLLASVAASQRKDGLAPPDSLIERIQRLREDAKDALTNEQRLTLAARLFSVLPEVATQIVRETASTATPGSSVDWAIASMVVANAAATAKAGSSEQRDDTGSRIHAEIKDPDVRTFTTAAAASLRSISASDALAQAVTIENGRDRLFFLRHWADANCKRDDAIRVTDAAIDLIVATVEYSPNARDVLRVSRTLRYTKDQVLAGKCVDRITALLPDLAERGPTADLFRLRGLLAATTYRWDKTAGRSRFQDDYLALLDVTDVSIRAECLARFLSRLETADPEHKLEDLDNLHSSVKQDLEQAVAVTLAQTADHGEMLKPVVAALAGAHPSIAEEYIARANTPIRRNNLRINFVRHCLGGSLQSQNLKAVLRAIGTSEDSSTRSVCIMTAWEVFSNNESSLAACDGSLAAFVGLVKQCGEAEDRASCAAIAFSSLLLGQVPGFDLHKQALRELIEQSLSEIDDAWDAVDSALNACQQVAKADRDVATKCLSFAQKIQGERLAGQLGSSWIVIAPIRLAINAMAGMMRTGTEDAADVSRVVTLIRWLPSAVHRAQLRAELAAWFYSCGRIDACKEIVRDHVLPEIREFESTGNEVFRQCVVAAADALFLANPQTAYVLFEKLDADYRDQAIYRAVRAKVHGVPAAEPFQYEAAHAKPLTREDIEEIVPLVRLVDADSLIALIVERIASSIIAAGPSAFPHQQSSAISSQLKDAARRMLPRPTWIAHEGYLILCDAYAQRLLGKKLEYGDPIVARAKAVSNRSDQALILTELASLSNLTSAKRLLEEAALIIRSLEVEVERVERLANTGETAMRVDGLMGRQLLREACLLSQSCDRGDMAAVRRRAMDTVFKADPELAGAMAEAIDSDPARISARAKRTKDQMQEQLKQLEAGKAVIEHASEEALPAGAELGRLPAATWSGLASLNAGRAEAKTLQELRSFIRFASQLPLSKAYPIMAWVLANLRVRSGGSNQASGVFSGFFDACTLVAEFSTAAALPSHSLKVPSPAASDGGFLVRIGQKKEAREAQSRPSDSGGGSIRLWTIARSISSCR